MITVDDIRVLFRMASASPLWPEQREWLQTKAQALEDGIKAQTQAQAEAASNPLEEAEKLPAEDPAESFAEGA